MLARIQEALAKLYDLEVTHPVEDFVCSSSVAREAVGDEVARGELLMVAEEPDGVALGLYVDPGAVERLRAAEEAGVVDSWREGATFEATCLATEGVSHFVYLVFRMLSDSAVSQLELELQAEVDKYATGLLAGNGIGAIQARSRALRRRLYEDAEFIDEEGSEAGERYRLATRLAGHYAAWLERSYVEKGDFTGLRAHLRRFYRMGARSKLEFARACVAP